MRKIKFLFFSSVLVLGFFSASKTSYADYCSGSITCCANSAFTCSLSDGSRCIAGDPGCSCSTKCIDWDIPQTCYLSGGSCKVPNACSDLAKGGCYYNVSVPPPTCPNGVLDPGEDCTNCPDDVIATGGSCSAPGPTATSSSGSSGPGCGQSCNISTVDCPNCVSNSSGGKYCWCTQTTSGTCDSPRCHIDLPKQIDIKEGYPYFLDTRNDVHTSNGTTSWKRIALLTDDASGLIDPTKKPVLLLASENDNILPNLADWPSLSAAEQQAVVDENRKAYNVTKSGSVSDVNTKVNRSGDLTHPLNSVEVIDRTGDKDNHGNRWGWYLHPLSLGTQRIRVSMHGSSDCSSKTCNNSVDDIYINVKPADPWPQLTGGPGVLVNGAIGAPIPIPCIEDVNCPSDFVLPDQDTNTTGVVIHNGGAYFSAAPLVNPGSANISDWVSQASYSDSAPTYNYDSFYGLAKGQNFYEVPIGGSIGSTGDINNIAKTNTDAKGYTWIHSAGDLLLGNVINYNGGKKTIIFVEGDLYINGDIQTNDTSSNFIMFVVKGNINIDPSVGSNSANPENNPSLIGIYITDGIFSTGTVGGINKDLPFVLQGSVFANDFNLQRNLQEDNKSAPSEIFVYDANFEINYPSALAKKRFVQLEVGA